MAMTNTTMEKYSAGFGLSLVITNLLNAVILVVKEKSASIMGGMKAALGHHWTTHGVILIIVFVLLGLIFSSRNLGVTWGSQRMMNYIIWSVIISGVVIAGFFLPYLTIFGN